VRNIIQINKVLAFGATMPDENNVVDADKDLAEQNRQLDKM
jgi:hypothetical protein